jgi:CNT family concentrative nucleoside transporter
MRLVSFIGIFVLMGIAWLMSSNKRMFPWRIVLFGVGLQFVFALFILKTPAGLAVFDSARLGLRAMIGGALASYQTATIAGLLIP